MHNNAPIRRHVFAKACRHGHWMIVLLLALGIQSAVAQVRRIDPPKPAVYVEDSPSAHDLIQRARQLRGQNRLPEAARLYQQVIDEYAHKLAEVEEDTLYTDIARQVQIEIAGDEQLLEAYRRLHEALARREMRDAIASGSLSAIEEVVQRFRMCDAGLDAALHLTGLWLEAGAPAYARTVLDELQTHPSLPQHQQRYLYLQACTALLSGEADRFAQLQQQLAEIDPNGALALQELSATLAPPTQNNPRDVLTPATDLSVPQVVDQPLWELAIPASDQTMVEGPFNSWQRPDARIAVSTGDFRILPSMLGDSLYMTDGMTLARLDRNSGQVIWEYQPEQEEDPNDPRLRALGAFNMPYLDQRAVMISSRYVAAVLGPISRWPARFGMKVRTTSVSCHEAQTGELLWSHEAGDVDPSLSNAFFHGTPIWGEDRIFVLARRSQPSGFHDAFVVCLAAGDGSLLWKRHLSSANTGDRYRNFTPLTQMLRQGNLLYIADNLGAITCMEARSGTVQWLRVADPGQDGAAQMARERSHISEPSSLPMVLGDKLLTLWHAEKPFGLVLDRHTGELLQTLQDKSWERTEYLIPAGDDVLCVGTHLGITCLDGKTFKPKWTAFAPPETVLRGRPTVVGDQVLVTTVTKLLIADLKTGRVVREHEMDMPGNILALDHQLVVAGDTMVRGYMSWEHAYQRLSQQMQDNPADPRPAVALAMVALNVGHHEVLLDTIDQAMIGLHKRRALQPDPMEDSLQREVVSKFMSLLDPKRKLDVKVRRALFDRLATTTLNPAQEVQFQLTLGSFLAETGDPALAAEHFQAVLTNPLLASQIYEAENVWRRAALEARLRLQSLLDEAGPECYAMFNELASMRLDELTHRPDTTPQDLIDLAQQYPLAQAAPLALIRAAQMQIEKEPNTSLMHLRRAYRLAREPQHLATIVGTMADYYQTHQQPRLAVQWLSRLQEEHPQLQPLRNGTAISTEAWLAELRAQPTAQIRLPNIKMPLAKPRTVPGGLLLARQQPLETMLRDRVLTHDHKTLRLFGGEAFEELWNQPSPERTVVLASMTDEQILLWLPRSGRLCVLETESGKTRWMSPSLQDLLLDRAGGKPIAPEMRELDLIMDNGPIQMRGGVPVRAPVNDSLLLAVNQTVAIVATQDGKAMAIDRDEGEVLWQTQLPFEVLTLMAANNEAVALGGINGTRTNSTNGEIVVLDPRTGEQHFPTIIETDALRWLDVSDQGLLVYTTQSQIVAHQLHDGTPSWRTTHLGQPLSDDGWLSSQNVLVREAPGVVVVVDLFSGKATAAPAVTARLLQPLQVQNLDKTWYVLQHWQACAIGADGKLAWTDSIIEPGKRLIAQFVSQQHVGLISHAQVDDFFDHEHMPAQEAAPLLHPEMGLEEARRAEIAATKYRFYLLDRDKGTIVHEAAIPPLPGGINPSQAWLLEQGMVLGNAESTLLIQGGAQEP